MSHPFFLVFVLSAVLVSCTSMQAPQTGVEVSLAVPSATVAQEVTLISGVENKNPNYGINLSITTDAGAIVGQTVNSLFGVRARGVNARWTILQGPTQAPVFLDKPLTVTLTSVHNADGLQLEGVWDGNLDVTFTLADGTVKHYLSPYFKIDHKGGLLAPNYKTRSVTFTIPALQ